MPGRVPGELRSVIFEGYSGEREADRLRRIMARFIAAAYLVYLTLAVIQWTTVDELPVPDWFVPLAILLAAGPGLALLPASYVSRTWMLQFFAMLTPVGVLMAFQLWVIVWNGESYGSTDVGWLSPFVGLPALAVVLLRSLWNAFFVLLVCALGLASVYALGVGGLTGEVIARFIWAIAFAGVFMVAISRLVSSGRLLQQSRAEAVAAAAESSAMAAWQVERDRFAALIHDHVIATLVAATSAPDDNRLPDQARATLAALDRVAQTSSAVRPPMTAGAAIAAIRSVITAIDENVKVDIRYLPDGAGPPSGGFPQSANDAVAEAAGEAVRNSVRHAGPRATRAALIQLGEGVLRVTVVDDGVGFDPQDIPYERLGIEVSIRRRMAAVPGGMARLQSAPGQGTTVQIGWQS